MTREEARKILMPKIEAWRDQDDLRAFVDFCADEVIAAYAAALEDAARLADKECLCEEDDVCNMCSLASTLRALGKGKDAV